MQHKHETTMKTVSKSHQVETLQNVSIGKMKKKNVLSIYTYYLLL